MSSAGDWSEVKDAASGKNYYVNKRTNVTQWEVPAEFASGGAAAVAATSASDWSEVKDAASGKNYYVNKRTNVTQWEVPAGFGGGGAAAAGASARPVAKAAAYAEPQTVRAGRGSCGCAHCRAFVGVYLCVCAVVSPRSRPTAYPPAGGREARCARKKVYRGAQAGEGALAALSVCVPCGEWLLLVLLVAAPCPPHPPPLCHFRRA